ncbi:hypothetical protein B9T24_16410 [Acinetobacter sp. ANC 4654]|nr:hypothetical protein B9T24_16410 [Acinetobacter sp. ANC 4654]
MICGFIYLGVGMSFFQWNFLFLIVCALFVHIFFKKNVKVRIYENVFLIIYAPILLFIYLNNKEPNLSDMQLSIFLLFLFEIFSILKIYKLFKHIR